MKYKKLGRKLLFIAAITILSANIVKAYNRTDITDQTNYIKVVVAPGDTIWSIAKEHNTYSDIRKLVYDIRKLNNITPIIQPGQVLKVPVRR
jgi:LysM repeat protein